MTLVAARRSREGAWIEIRICLGIGKVTIGRSREGAWIEIIVGGRGALHILVAPVRERGLKFITTQSVLKDGQVAPVRERGLKYIPLSKRMVMVHSRSREGSWIEISITTSLPKRSPSRSREGAWIEIRNTVGFSVLLTQMTYSD